MRKRRYRVIKLFNFVFLVIVVRCFFVSLSKGRKIILVEVRILRRLKLVNYDFELNLIRVLLVFSVKELFFLYLKIDYLNKYNLNILIIEKFWKILIWLLVWFFFKFFRII